MPPSGMTDPGAQTQIGTLNSPESGMFGVGITVSQRTSSTGTVTRFGAGVPPSETLSRSQAMSSGMAGPGVSFVQLVNDV